jgi:hypothetical protein
MVPRPLVVDVSGRGNLYGKEGVNGSSPLEGLGVFGVVERKALAAVGLVGLSVSSF